MDPRKVFSAGRLLAVKVKAPYMAAIILAFAPVDAPGLGTIGVTEHGVLMIDWEFIAKLGDGRPDGMQATEEMAGLLVHEAFHVLLKHGKRGRVAGRDRQLDNDAADLAINPGCIDMGCKLPGGGPGVTPEHPLHGMYPEDLGWPRGETTDQYYERLRKRQPPPPKGGSGSAKGQPGDESGKGAQPSQDGSQGSPGEGGAQGEGGEGNGPSTPQGGSGGAHSKKPKAGGGWCGSCAGNPLPNEPKADAPESRSEAEMGRLARQVAAAVKEAAARGKGHVPAFLARWAEELLEPAEVPWEQELAMVTRHACAWRENAADHRYDAPSRRQAGIGYGPGRPILPRLRMPMPDVHIVFDTSGSMGTEELSVGGREVNGILKAVGANITLCTIDSAVTGVTKVKTIKEAISRLKGGGGTDMRPGFAAVMKCRPRPQVIVCITDLQIGDVGVQPAGVKVIWVGVGPYQGPDPAWGRVVRIKKKSNRTNNAA